MRPWQTKQVTLPRYCKTENPWRRYPVAIGKTGKASIFIHTTRGKSCVPFGLSPDRRLLFGKQVGCTKPIPSKPGRSYQFLRELKRYRKTRVYCMLENRVLGIPSVFRGPLESEGCSFSTLLHHPSPTASANASSSPLDAPSITAKTSHLLLD